MSTVVTLLVSSAAAVAAYFAFGVGTAILDGVLTAVGLWIAFRLAARTRPE
jgi:hypothetical protein